MIAYHAYAHFLHVDIVMGCGHRLRVAQAGRVWRVQALYVYDPDPPPT